MVKSGNIAIKQPLKIKKEKAGNKRKGGNKLAIYALKLRPSAA